MTAVLVPPSLEYEQSYGAYIVELGDEERYPFPLDFEHHDFGALLQRLSDFSNGTNIPEGFVPSSTFWLVDGAEIIGVTNLRHYLNERIRRCGGHIGLGVRPSFRGRGIGNLLMALTIQEARKRGIREIHIHCHKGNAASARMIVSNGGVLDSEVSDGESAEVVQRYVVAAT
ncbi:MAG: GNAT family N-acetyltransferase [Pseudomonadales bacterium]